LVEGEDAFDDEDVVADALDDGDAGGDEDAVESESGSFVLRTTVIAAITTRLAARIRRTRLRRGVDRADWP